MSHEEPRTPPTAEAAARRLLILKHVVAYALAAPPRDMLKKLSAQWSMEDRSKFQQQAEARRDEICRRLQSVGLWEHMSPREQGYSQGTLVTMTEREQIKGSWRMEGVQTLMWALGLLPALPPYDTMADPGLLKQVPSQDVASFVRTARLREQAALVRARDAAESWHWRSRTRELVERGDAFPDDPRMQAAGFCSYDDVVRFSARRHAQEGTIPQCIEEDFPAKEKALNNPEMAMKKTANWDPCALIRKNRG